MNLPIMALHIGSTVGSLNYSAYTSCVCGCAREFGLCVWCQRYMYFKGILKQITFLSNDEDMKGTQLWQQLGLAIYVPEI